MLSPDLGTVLQSSKDGEHIFCFTFTVPFFELLGLKGVAEHKLFCNADDMNGAKAQLDHFMPRKKTSETELQRFALEAIRRSSDAKPKGELFDGEGGAADAE